MSGELINQNNLTDGDKVTFSYHDKNRMGQVEEVAKAYFTLKHDGDSTSKEREYSNFRFDKVDGRKPSATGISMLGHTS